MTDLIYTNPPLRGSRTDDSIDENRSVKRGSELQQLLCICRGCTDRICRQDTVRDSKHFFGKDILAVFYTLLYSRTERSRYTDQFCYVKYSSPIDVV